MHWFPWKSAARKNPAVSSKCWQALHHGPATEGLYTYGACRGLHSLCANSYHKLLFLSAQTEILNSEIFSRVRKERPDFDEYARQKLLPIPGELTQSQCGITDQHLNFLYETTHVILHCAAVVDFNERLDRAVELNTMGSLRMLDIAKKCKHLGAFVHVSTCYVNSNRTGWVDEKLYPLGFDPEAMVKKIRGMNANELERVAVSGKVHLLCFL